MGKDTLEMIVTVGLFLLNSIIISVFASVYVVYTLAIDVNRLLRCRKFKVMRLVTDKAVVALELARPDTGREGGAAANDPDGAIPALCWRHPDTGAAQVHPPKQVYSRDGVAKGVWGWTDADGKKSWSENTPQLVAALDEGEILTPGDFVCNIDTKTLIMSPLAEVPPDVMGSRDDRRGNGAADEALEAAVDGDGVEMRGLAQQGNPRYAGERTLDPVDEGTREVANPMQRVRPQAFVGGEDELERHGGIEAWDAAETREGEDGVAYTKAEFMEQYGGLDEWDAVETRRGDAEIGNFVNSGVRDGLRNNDGEIADDEGNPVAEELEFTDSLSLSDTDSLSLSDTVEDEPGTRTDERGEVNVGASKKEMKVVGAAASQRGDVDEECWYYEYADDESPETHGPFSLIDLMHWRDSNDLENDQPIRSGEGGASIELLEALFDAGLDDDAWWYDGDSSDDLQHGPYTIEHIGEWLKAGHFEEHDLIHRGREGEPVEAGSIIE